MFWNKKSKDSGLPDLPIPKSSFMNPEIPPIRSGISPPINRFPINEKESDIEESEDSEDISSRHNLPSFPDSPIKKGFSQTAIKEAVNNDESEEENNEDYEEERQIPMSRNFKTVEMGLDNLRDNKIPMPPESQIMPKRSPDIISSDSKNKEVFVKIDKFQSAKKALTSAQEKVQEIEFTLRKIRETRMREEQELTSWEKDIESIKLKIEEISKGIFDKI